MKDAETVAAYDQTIAEIRETFAQMGIDTDDAQELRIVKATAMVMARLGPMRAYAFIECLNEMP